MATFSNFVFNVDSEYPKQIGPSLSASNNSVILLSNDVIFNTKTAVPKTVFTVLTSGYSTQQSSITGSVALSGYYSGWKTSGIPAGTHYIGAEVSELTGIYSGVNGLSSEFSTLTGSFEIYSSFYTPQLSGKTPVGILFNQITGASTATTTLSVGTLVFKVAPQYNGSTFAVYFSDHSSTTFTVATGTPAQGTIANSFDNRGPNERRRFAVEF